VGAAPFTCRADRRTDAVVSQKPRYTFEQMNDRVAGVIAALKDENNVIDTELAADALAFVAAIQFDLDPANSAPSRLRRAAEEHAAVVYRYARFLRNHYEKHGIHFAEQIGGEVTITGDLPAGHTRH